MIFLKQSSKKKKVYKWSKRTEFIYKLINNIFEEKKIFNLWYQISNCNKFRLNDSFALSIILLGFISINVPVTATDLLRWIIKDRMNFDSSLNDILKYDNISNNISMIKLIRPETIYKSMNKLDKILSGNEMNFENFHESQNNLKKNNLIWSELNHYAIKLIQRTIKYALLPPEIYPVAASIFMINLKHNPLVKNPCESKPFYKNLNYIGAAVIAAARLYFCQMRHLQQCEWDSKIPLNALWPIKLELLAYDSLSPDLDLSFLDGTHNSIFEKNNFPKLFKLEKNSIYDNIMSRAKNNDTKISKLKELLKDADYSLFENSDQTPFDKTEDNTCPDYSKLCLETPLGISCNLYKNINYYPAWRRKYSKSTDFNNKLKEKHHITLQILFIRISTLLSISQYSISLALYQIEKLICES